MIRTWAWRIFWTVVVIAVVSYVAKSPTTTGVSAAAMGHKVIGWVQGGIAAIITFVTQLAS